MEMKLYADLHRGSLPAIKAGDEVLLDMKNLQRLEPTKKLADKWAGPYKVVKPVGKVSFRLRLPETLPIWPVFHASLLEPYKRKDFPGRKQLDEPPPVEIEGEPEYEVEHIHDTRCHRGKVKYLIQWRGYQERTWEPLENLKHSSDLVEQFHKQYPEAIKPQNLRQWLGARHRKKQGSYGALQKNNWSESTATLVNNDTFTRKVTRTKDNSQGVERKRSNDESNEN